MVDIWYKFLLNLRMHPQERISDYLGILRTRVECIVHSFHLIIIHESIPGEAQIGEATEMLKKILDTRTRFLGAQHIATGEVCGTVQFF